MSSYHLPCRGLPQELFDMIFEYALCKREGIKVKQFKNPDLDEMGVTIPVRNIRPDTGDVALSLFGVSRHVGAVAQDIFYRKNVFILAINPDEGFEWLRRINARHPRQLEHVHLTREAFAPFNAHVDVAPFFLSKLWAATPLKTLTIAMPGDLLAGAWCSNSTRECTDNVESAEFVATMRAFKAGRVQTVRLAYPRWYALGTATTSFFSVGMAVTCHLVDHDCGRRVLHLLRCSRGAAGLRMRAVAREERRLFREGGFVAYRGVRRPNEKGTVVVIQRAEEAERSLRLRREGKERSGVLRVMA